MASNAFAKRNSAAGPVIVRPGKHLTLLAVCVTLATLATQTNALASSSDSNADGTEVGADAPKAADSAKRFAFRARTGAHPKRTGCPTAPGTAEGGSSSGTAMPLDDIQDVAFTLQRIRQQAINIFIESTREKHTRYDLNIPSLSSMPKIPLKDENAYLPLRKGWLVFFIGTMEPLIQILNEELKHLDENAEQKDVPAAKLPQWQGIVKEWKIAFPGLIDQLNNCSNLLDEPSAANIAVAKSAQAIDQQVSVLDDILHKASKFLQESTANK